MSVIVFESGDTIRRFENVAGDDVWRLVHVQHGRGWVRLEWQQGVLTGLASDRGRVDLSRRADGRITAARDDLGRAIAYSYGVTGRLIEVTDLGGSVWRYGYNGDTLTSLIDPRGKTVLEAGYVAGKVATMRALHARTTFHYEATSTRAVDSFGRTTTFLHTPAGLTTGVADPLGHLMQLAFDAAFRPVAVTRDGVPVARMSYDAAGRLASLWRPGGDRTFSYSQGRLIAVSGAETAHYRYVEGRVLEASDTGGQRTYAYGAWN